MDVFVDICVFLLDKLGCTTDSNHYYQIKKRLNEVKDCTYIEVCLETGERVHELFQLGEFL